MPDLKKNNFENNLFSLCFGTAGIASLVALTAMWYAQLSWFFIVFSGLLLLILSWFAAWTVKSQVITQFQSLTNLLEAVTVGDYTLRGRQARGSGALSELTQQINFLTDTLMRQRYEVKESQILLAKVISHIDVAIFAFDHNRKITLVNPAGEKLLRQKQKALLGQTIGQWLPDTVLAQRDGVAEFNFPADSGQFQVRQDEFMENNQKHSILFITNVQALLRAEELKAWQNLIRVISHEINNTLTPIASLSQVLLTQVTEKGEPVLEEGLSVISERAKGLARFIESYRQLSRVPQPQWQKVVIGKLVEDIQQLYPNQSFEQEGDPGLQIDGDPTLLQQLLINLVKNAIEANQDSKKPIAISWQNNNGKLELSIRDHGAGIANPNNLFVPFYSTKQQGTGIGLVLCRQIVEAHHGRLTLQNHQQGGCVASISLSRERNS